MFFSHSSSSPLSLLTLTIISTIYIIPLSSCLLSLPISSWASTILCWLFLRCLYSHSFNIFLHFFNQYSLCLSLCWAMIYTRGGQTIVSGPILACGTGVKKDFYTFTVYDPFPKGHKNNRSKKQRRNVIESIGG